MPLSVRGHVAHSGHPFTDLGNLLRFDRRPTYLEAVLGAWCERRGGTPPEALDLARAGDLWALVDLAARAGENPVAVDRGDPDGSDQGFTRARSQLHPSKELLSI